MRRSLPVVFMPHDDHHPVLDAEAPYRMPRPCDHCSRVLPEGELIPYPKTSSYLADAPELVCKPCRQRIERRSMRSQEHRVISEKCLMHHDLQETVSYDVGNCTACGASFLRGTRMFECSTCTTCGLTAWIVNVLGTCARATTSDSRMLIRELVGKPCIG